VEKCKDCKFFDKFAGSDTGTCKRYPPVLVIDRATDVKDTSYWAQPVVQKSGGCGEGVQ